MLFRRQKRQKPGRQAERQETRTENCHHRRDRRRRTQPSMMAMPCRQVKTVVDPFRITCDMCAVSLPESRE